MRYTFLCEKQGSTFAEQVLAPSLREAVQRWHEESASRPGPPLDTELDPPTPIEGLRNVWCIAGTDPDGHPYLCNIVATSEVPMMAHRKPMVTEEPDLPSVEVLPGVGFGPILFGMTIDETEAALGPIVDSTLHDDGVERSLRVSYEEVGIHLLFEVGKDDSDFRLYAIEVDEACPCDLFEAPLFPKTRDEVRELLRQQLEPDEFADIDEETDEEAEEIRLDVFPLGMTFIFDLSSDELAVVEWGVLFDENDQPLWPQPDDAEESDETDES
jgi:hypothetical protein